MTLDYLDSIEGALSGPCLITGHPGPGVARRLAGHADIITLLRRPDHQAVSNYLHILADPDSALGQSAGRQSISAFFRENPHLIVFQAISLAVALSTRDEPIDALTPEGLDTLLHFLESLTFVGSTDRAEACCAQLSARLSIDPPLRMAHRNSALYRGVSPQEVKRLLQEYRTLGSEPELSNLFDIEDRLYAKADALLTRSAGKLTPAARLSRRPSPAGTLGADSFDSAAGYLTGERYICPLADGPDRRLPHHLIYGPFCRLARGSHLVEFHFSLRTPAGHGRIEIEILANGVHCLSKRWLRTTMPHRRTLYFFNRDAADILEFRLRAKGFDGGDLEFRGVTASRAAPHRSWRSLIGAIVRRRVRSIIRAVLGSLSPERTARLP